MPRGNWKAGFTTQPPSDLSIYSCIPGFVHAKFGYSPHCILRARNRGCVSLCARAMRKRFQMRATHTHPPMCPAISKFPSTHDVKEPRCNPWPMCSNPPSLSSHPASMSSLMAEQRVKQAKRAIQASKPTGRLRTQEEREGFGT